MGLSFCGLENKEIKKRKESNTKKRKETKKQKK